MARAISSPYDVSGVKRGDTLLPRFVAGIQEVLGWIGQRLFCTGQAYGRVTAYLAGCFVEENASAQLNLCFQRPLPF